MTGPKLFIAPTILEGSRWTLPVMQEEIFGPILPVFSFRTDAEAINIINRNPNPLSLYVFTGSRKKAKEWLEKIQFGTGCVNNAAWQFRITTCLLVALDRVEWADIMVSIALMFLRIRRR